MFRRLWSRGILWLGALSFLVASGVSLPRLAFAATGSPVTVTLSAQPNPVTAGQPLTLTATVQPSASPTETVGCGPANSLGYYTGLSSQQQDAQVFTAPVSGILETAAVEVSPRPTAAAPISVALTDWTGSAPGAVIATGTMTGAQSGGLSLVTFSGSLPPVTQGTEYALVFSLPPGNSNSYEINFSQTPCSGDLMYGNPGSGWVNDFGSSVFSLAIASTPTGTVTFYEGTAPSLLGTAPVGPSGAATLTLPGLTTAGTVSLTASYSGDSTYAPAIGSATLTVNPGVPASLTLSGPSTGQVQQLAGPYTLTVTDVYGNPTPVASPLAVTLQASAPGVTFYSTPTSGASSATTTITIPTGETTTGFWLLADQPGPITVTAQGPTGFSGAPLAVTIQPEAPAAVTLTGPTVGPVGPRLGPYTLTVTDVYGNPSPVTSPLIVTLTASLGTTFYPAAQGGAAITTVAVYTGRATATFWLAGTEPGVTTVTAQAALGTASQAVNLVGVPTLSFAPTRSVTQDTSAPGLLVPLYLTAPPGNSGPVPVTVYGETGSPPAIVGAVYATATALTPLHTVSVNPGAMDAVYFDPGPAPAGTTLTLVAESPAGTSPPLTLTIVAPGTSSGSPPVLVSSGSGGGGGGISAGPGTGTTSSNRITTDLLPPGNTVTGPTITITAPPHAVARQTPVTLTLLTAWPTTLPALPGPVLAGFQATLGTGAGPLLQPLTVHLTVSLGPGEPLPGSPLVVTFWNPLTHHWQLVPHATTGGTPPGGLQVTFQTWHLTTFVVTTAIATPTVSRLAGATRMATAIQAAEAAFPDGAVNAVLVNAGRGGPSPDALAAAGLAGALHAPILLTPGSALDPMVLTAFQTLGTQTVYVLGGPAAISDAVVATLQAHHLTVVRAFEGATRFATARLVDQYLFQHHLTAASTVFVANGATLVDALAASPVLDQQAAPLLLVAPGQTTLSGATAAWLRGQSFQQVVVLGGPQAVSDALAQALGRATGAPVLRLGGATRTGTAVTMATHFFGTHPEGAVLAASGADGSSFVDALSAAPFAATNQVPILLTNPGSLPGSTGQYLQALTSGSPLWVLGGPQAVSPPVVTALQLLGS